MIEIGRVVLLQVQTDSLKRGERPRRVYDPAPLSEVSRLRVSPSGAAGVTAAGEEILDVHHPGHPRTKTAPGREVSFGFTSHYGRMHDRYGAHVTIGCAGENVLVESGRIWRLEDFAAGLAFRNAAGALLPLEQISVAAPCVEFSRFSLGDPQVSPQDLKPVLQFLDEGTRGYVFTPGGKGEVAIGDALVLRG
ncbi:MAG: hypothetical protein WEB59_15275 [Thermoanaerobaculia bacterium]